MTLKQLSPPPQVFWRRLIALIQRTSATKPPSRRPAYKPERHRRRYREKLFPMF